MNINNPVESGFSFVFWELPPPIASFSVRLPALALITNPLLCYVVVTKVAWRWINSARLYDAAIPELLFHGSMFTYIHIYAYICIYI